ncbi:hypothetical protein THAOC_11451 [Thalassiosira oceanica]|uniref:Uncharacterized protein n=1 Tax=Thalassiosira oceanica TaxID=159749 RepID=K0TAF5_THAOC|nr:hypothetical protein THAOC_11451 [Thalassiosira oceanica]|eukprot:EJK67502.1 hypothetical protein THAOC_11451 [Thalassiosira oceanica]
MTTGRPVRRGSAPAAPVDIARAPAGDRRRARRVTWTSARPGGEVDGDGDGRQAAGMAGDVRRPRDMDGGRHDRAGMVGWGGAADIIEGIPEEGFLQSPEESLRSQERARRAEELDEVKDYISTASTPKTTGPKPGVVSNWQETKDPNDLSAGDTLGSPNGISNLPDRGNIVTRSDVSVVSAITLDSRVIDVDSDKRARAPRRGEKLREMQEWQEKNLRKARQFPPPSRNGSTGKSSNFVRRGSNGYFNGSSDNLNLNDLNGSSGYLGSPAKGSARASLGANPSSFHSAKSIATPTPYPRGSVDGGSDGILPAMPPLPLGEFGRRDSEPGCRSSAESTGARSFHSMPSNNVPSPSARRSSVTSSGNRSSSRSVGNVPPPRRRSGSRGGGGSRSQHQPTSPRTPREISASGWHGASVSSGHGHEEKMIMTPPSSIYLRGAYGSMSGASSALSPGSRSSERPTAGGPSPTARRAGAEAAEAVVEGGGGGERASPPMHGSSGGSPCGGSSSGGTESNCHLRDDIDDGSDGFGDETGTDHEQSCSSLDFTIQKMKALAHEELTDNSPLERRNTSSLLAIPIDGCGSSTKFTQGSRRGSAIVTQAERNQCERYHQIAQPPSNHGHKRSGTNSEDDGSGKTSGHINLTPSTSVSSMSPLKSKPSPKSVTADLPCADSSNPPNIVRYHSRQRKEASKPAEANAKEHSSERIRLIMERKRQQNQQVEEVEGLEDDSSDASGPSNVLYATRNRLKKYLSSNIRSKKGESTTSVQLQHKAGPHAQVVLTDSAFASHDKSRLRESKTSSTDHSSSLDSSYSSKEDAMVPKSEASWRWSAVVVKGITFEGVWTHGKLSTNLTVQEDEPVMTGDYDKKKAKQMGIQYIISKRSKKSNSSTAAPKYQLGDALHSQKDMIAKKSKSEATHSVSVLMKYEWCFVKRSNGVWTAAVLVDRGLQPRRRQQNERATWHSLWDIDSSSMDLEESMLFVVNEDADAKIIGRSCWGKYVRRMSVQAQH